MTKETRTVEIDLQVYELACRGAALDHVDVAGYLETMVLCDAELIKAREFVEKVSPFRREKQTGATARGLNCRGLVPGAPARAATVPAFTRLSATRPAAE